MKIGGLFQKDEEFKQKLIKIALPVALQNMSASLLSVIDMMILGSLGDAPLAAVSLSNQVAFVVGLMAFGICGGGAVLISQFFGRNDYGGISRTLKTMLLATGFISLFISLTAQFFPVALMRLFTGDQAVIKHGVTYFRITAFSYVFLGVSTAFMAFFRCIQKAKYTLYAAVVLVLVKTVLNFYFIRFQGMGVTGAGIATFAARIIEIAVYLTLAFAADEFILIIKNSAKITLESIKQFARVASSVLAHEAFCGLVILIMSATYARISTSAVVAMNICGAVQELVSCAAYGIAGACAVIVGREVGAENHALAKKYADRFATISLAVGVFVAAFMLLIAKPYVNTFFKGIEKESMSLSVYAISIVGLYMPFRYVSSTLNMGVLRAGGDAFRAMLYDCVPYYLTSVGLGFLLGIIYRMPLYIVLPVANLYIAIRLVIILVRVKSGKWLKKVI